MLVGSNSCASNHSDGANVPEPKLHQYLVDVYEEYRRYKEQDDTGEPFESLLPFVRIIEEHIFINAVAINDAQKLKQELEQIGAKRVAVYGLHVSCRLPILSIDELASLGSLRSAQPVMSTTGN